MVAGCAFRDAFAIYFLLRRRNVMSTFGEAAGEVLVSLLLLCYSQQLSGRHVTGFETTGQATEKKNGKKEKQEKGKDKR